MSVNKPRTNTQNKTTEQTAGSRFRFSMDWESIFSSPKGTLAWGMFFIVLGIVMEISFLSYILTGLADQSIVDGLGHESIRDAGRQTRNSLGVLGATISHIFVYRWFGISAILIPIISFLAGWKIAFKKNCCRLPEQPRKLFSSFCGVVS
nr:DNA translocase FtsK 4TM domain-containing protein [Dyadobacter sp. NIV53]